MTFYHPRDDEIKRLRERLDALEKYVRWTGPRCTYSEGDGPYCTNPAEVCHYENGGRFDYRCEAHR